MVGHIEKMIREIPEVEGASRRTGLELGLAAVTEVNRGDIAVGWSFCATNLIVLMDVRLAENHWDSGSDPRLPRQHSHVSARDGN